MSTILQPSATVRARFAADVASGLSKPQKQLPSEYLYDAIGTTLFDAITLLPEYGLTRADRRVIRRLAGELTGDYSTVVELGSGTGSKSRDILEGLRPDAYVPIDVSAEALRACQSELQGEWRITPLHTSYLCGLEAAVGARPGRGNMLVLFLGSTIGNFEPAERADFLAQVRSMLDPGDALLIGFDLVKPAPELLLAYDDPCGVTAAFNLNLLARMNRELGANFDLRSFAHEARYDAAQQRVEMHLLSRVHQRVDVPAAQMSCTLERGETIWTESSYKFQLDQIRELASSAGFQYQRHWLDGSWPFAESYWIA